MKDKIIDSKQFDYIMFFCACCYPLLKYSYREIGDIFQTILIIGSLFHIYKYRNYFIKDKMVKCLFISILLTITAWVASLYYIPDLARSMPKISVLSKLFFFIIIAYWLKGSTKRVHAFLSCYIVGVFLLFNSHSTNFIQETQQGLNGTRVDYGVVNANHPAVLSGIAFIICVFYSIKSVFSLTQHFTIKKTSMFLGLITLLIYFGLVVIITQSRQVWLAIPLAFLIAPVIYIITKKPNKKMFYLISVSTLSLVLLAISIASQFSYVDKRSNSEKNVISEILTGHISDLPYTSTGIRIHFWLEALPWIQKNPLFGYGEEARGLVISQSTDLPSYIKAQFSHLHNSYIELVVQYGTPALLLFLYVYISLIKSTTFQKDSNEMYYLSLLFFIFWIITNNFESYTLQKTGEVVSNVIFPCFYTFHLTNKLFEFKTQNLKTLFCQT
ncbi:O-antigen ligase family protein [Vibrio sp. S11_S32]|uniref:O-antigen ligase family protein n=1 Tax=Vibrio sp. S11_S32 TaxID=2720225 RepID=UPI001680132C|nr:O-antigen ligase family protein [Vibrio sp. S11_S32]MBD1576853.1 O-antigen ligase family protein [Vibrio sp. S11_S32]